MKKWSEPQQNEAFRDELRLALAREAMATERREAVPPGLEARVFRGLPKPVRSYAWLVAASLAGLAVATASFFLRPQGDVLREKGAGFAAAAHVETLKLAVAHDGQVTRALEGSQIPLGAAVLFEVEMRGVDPRQGVELDLWYATGGGALQPIVSAHVVRQERVTLSNEDGYVAFTPKASGDYVFRAEARGHKLPGDADFKEVHLHVAP